jgi:protein-tyrosine phosphatase
MRILVVCLGNICRSPLAEGILQQQAQLTGFNWVVESAGTNGYHNGEAPHYLSQKVAKLHGLDISKQRSREFLSNDMEHYDKIYAMAIDVLEAIKDIAGKKYDSNKVSLFLEDQYPQQNKEVPDPWYGGEDGYHTVYQIIEDGAVAIMDAYTRTHSTEKNISL